MQRRASIKALSLSAALLVAVSGAALAKGDSGPGYRSGMVSCGTLAFRGQHRLVHRNLGCGPARRNAILVIKRLKEPTGFSCSLGRVEQGYASCSSGSKAFAVSPA
jgi:hypothetical protein